MFCGVGLGLTVRPGNDGPWLRLVDDFAIGLYLGTVFTGLFLAITWWIAGRKYPQQIGQWLWLVEGIAVLTSAGASQVTVTVIQHNQALSLCYAACYLGIVLLAGQVSRTWKIYLAIFGLYYLVYGLAFLMNYEAAALWARRLLEVHVLLRFGLLMALIGEFAQFRRFLRAHWSEQVGLVVAAYIVGFSLCFVMIPRFFFYLP